MKKLLLISCFLAVSGVIASGSFAEKPSGNLGETKFKENCVVCHPNGGNIINPNKTLHKKDREANNIKTADDIVKKMRNPGPGMTAFDKKTIPDNEARAIAQYILKTF